MVDERQHDVSRAVFGNKARLTVFAALARVDGSTYAAEIAEETGLAPNVVGGILDALAEAGVLEDLPAFPGQRRRYYGIPSLQLWDSAHELLERYGRQEAAR